MSELYKGFEIEITIEQQLDKGWKSSATIKPRLEDGVSGVLNLSYTTPSEAEDAARRFAKERIDKIVKR